MTNLAYEFADSGEYEQVIGVYTRLEQLKPDHIYPAIVKLWIESCAGQRAAPPGVWEALLAKAKQARAESFLTLTSLDGFAADIIRDKCWPGDHENMEKLLSILIENHNFNFIRAFLYEFSAALQAHKEQYEQALAYIDQALELGGKPSNYVYKINLLRGIGRYDEAERVIQAFRESLKGQPRRYLAYAKVLEGL